MIFLEDKMIMTTEMKYFKRKRDSLAEAYGNDTYVAIKGNRLWGLFKSPKKAEEYAKKEFSDGYALIKRLDEEI